MATSTNASDNDRNGCNSPVSQYDTASEGENLEAKNSLNSLSSTQIDENTPITSLTAGKMMELFAHSLTTERAQQAIQTSVVQLIDPIKSKLEETGRDVASLKTRIESLEHKHNTPTPFTVKVNDTPRGVATVDYTRRSNLVFTGIKGTPEECKTQLNKIFKKLGLKIGAFNTFRRGQNATNIIAEFAGHWDKILVYKNRTKLMDKGIRNVFINEDLNETQDRIFYLARSAKKQHLIHTAWTTEGITHISKVVKGVVQIKPVHSEEEIKSLLPKLKIEAATKTATKTTKAKLRKTNESTNDQGERSADVRAIRIATEVIKQKSRNE